MMLVSASAFANDRPRFLMSAAEDLPGVVDTPPMLVAQPPASTVAVLALAGAEGIQLSDLVLSAQQAIEKKTALKVTTLEPGQEKEVRSCAGDPECFARELRKSGSSADLLLTVSVTSIGDDQVLLGILLVDARSEAELAGRTKIKTGELAEELPPRSFRPTFGVRSRASRSAPTKRTPKSSSAAPVSLVSLRAPSTACSPVATKSS
jgi:hypothetical protein